MNYIYSYTNKINGHTYVGQTNDIERRKREHRSCANNKSSKQYLDLFHMKLRQYGEDNFIFSILETISTGEEDANIAEIKWIANKKSYCGDNYGGYNMTRGGKSPTQWIYPNKANLIKAMIKAGCPYEVITYTYNISPGHISNINYGRYYYDENETYPLHKYYKNDEEIEAIQDLLINSTLTMKEIADQVEMGYSSIKKINSGTLHHKDGLSYPLRKDIKIARANKIKQMLLDGATNKDIIKETSVSAETIKRINEGITFIDNSLIYPLRNPVTTIKG